MSKAAGTRALRRRLDHPADGRGSVAAEIVHDDDVALLEDRQELLFDIGAEAFAVDRAVEDARSGQPVTAQGAEEGQGAPAALRHKGPQPFALGSPSAERRHVGFDPGLVDEDQALRIEAFLKRPPALPPACDVGAGPFKREQRFF